MTKNILEIGFFILKAGKSSVNTVNKPKILAIDDEVKALDLLKLTLEPCGFDVSVAADGYVGLSKAVEEKPDVIILDIRMPKINGWQVNELLKSTDSTRNIPVVFLSAFSNAHDQERARNSGICACLIKPVDPDHLSSLIHIIISKRKSNDG